MCDRFVPCFLIAAFYLRSYAGPELSRTLG